ncbi:MAG: helix-turn-helix domain-containing protein [Pseudonocardiaceae bacterium]|nr:helix-turn-helix domain-containing protein [Pseudonocardiaceae bacterium]
MVGGRRTPRRGQSSPRCLGVISGFLLKLIRESAGLTQARLAEHLDVDVATIQGWESSRRPLTSLQASELVRLRSQLLQCGAEPIALGGLDDAIHADLITWPFTGGIPAQLLPLHRPVTRRGPVPTQPSLDERERTRFFDHLLVTADANPRNEGALLRRQAIYLLGFDRRSSTADWMHAEQRRAFRNAGRADDVTSWVAVRSSAVALATCGDSDPLRTFVHQSLATDQQEQANLNYWAYWVGEIDTVQVDDGFMGRIDPRTWSGVRLLGHLLARLHPGSGHADLNVHTVWSLLLAHPSLLIDHPALRSEAFGKVD